ncbi:MAG: type II toxin-antitoxin system RelE/ParE family toxin [Christensenellaceae bacterium]|nr:type II toxin-antitoxin system RelE/ParE family toxin [Christensenellaceae bacterium]
MRCTVDYYKTPRGDDPVKEFIDELPAKLRAKNMWEIGLLEEFGTDLPMPYAKPLRGYEDRGLWELRVKLASDITRVFYFYPRKDRVLLLHGFVKKTESTPPHEKELARSRMRDAIERSL